MILLLKQRGRVKGHKRGLLLLRTDMQSKREKRSDPFVNSKVAGMKEPKEEWSSC